VLQVGLHGDNGLRDDILDLFPESVHIALRLRLTDIVQDSC
jgi:hypothetical protein